MKMTVDHKSLNLLDFSRNREKDLFLCDVNSDRTRFGGQTETELAIHHEEKTGDTYLNIEAKFRKDRSGLLHIDYMFSGLECLSLVKSHFDYYNGFRITMRPPVYPCKLGVHVNTSIREFEHFIGHLVDTNSEQPKEWV